VLQTMQAVLSYIYDVRRIDLYRYIKYDFETSATTHTFLITQTPIIYVFVLKKKNGRLNNNDRMIFANGFPACYCANLWDRQYTVLHVCGEQYSTVSYTLDYMGDLRGHNSSRQRGTMNSPL
jgi:hypothetical protein